MAPCTTGGSIALGTLSGGSGNCSSGGTTFYQPVLPILRDFALTLWDTPLSREPDQRRAPS